jgi:hypothetical protein
MYWGRVASGFLTSSGRHPAFLWGQVKMDGWWYYFPAVGAQKVPLGLAAVLLLGVASLAWVRPRLGEISLVIPMMAWTALMLTTRINMGFRHFLPAYVFMLMLGSRCVAAGGRYVAGVAWAGVLAAAVHVTSWHPDYLSYWNYPRPRWWLLSSESNLDWGQADRQIARWLDAHPPPPGKPVYVLTRYGVAGYDGPYYLDHRVEFLQRGKPLPSHGLVIISPIWVTGVYDEPGQNLYEMLLKLEPVGVVGHAMLVYDLDQLHATAAGAAAAAAATEATTQP